MRVIYRMCGIPSTNPSPIYQDDKFKLNKLCLDSFTHAFSDIDLDVTFLLDHCGEQYRSLFENLPFEFNVEESTLGINGTMLRAYALAAQADDYVLLQECDYLYRGVVGKTYLEALSELDIVSPYDHLNFYLDQSIHSPVCEIALVGNHHYRTTERNTMTWATSADVIRENYDTLVKYGYLDDDVWRELAYAGHTLWVPIPSFATHMVKDYLAPSINWEELYGE